MKKQKTILEKFSKDELKAIAKESGHFTYKVKSHRFENYKGSNWFDLETLEARSYNWWPYLKKTRIGLVYNNYTFSNCTSKHQDELSWLLSKLRIKVDYALEFPRGIGENSAALKYYYTNLIQTQIELDRKNRKKDNDATRLSEIKAIRKNIAILRRLGGWFSKNEVKALKAKLLQDEQDRLKALREKRQKDSERFKKERLLLKQSAEQITNITF
jgi:hypothetical protein